MRFLKDALEIAHSKNDLRRKSISIDLIADIKSVEGDRSGARADYFESLKLKTELGDRKGIANTFSIIGELDYLENNLEEAKHNIYESLKIFEELQIKKSVFTCYHLLSKIYEKQDQLERSFEYFKIAHDKEIEYMNEEAEAKAKNIATQLEIEQAQKEAEIQRLKNIELANALDEVKMLNVSMNELNNEKNEFMAIAVHDLKNPLQTILSTARVIKRSPNRSESELNEFTANIISQTDRMFNLIKKLLDHNSLEQGTIKFKNTAFDVSEVCTEIVKNFTDQAEKKNLRMIYEENSENEVLYTDKEILYEILQNLVSNSIKF
jgi:signal transduction histidine kinase